MHVPQSVVTENELIELAAVPTQIISPRECKPIISVVQDVALGIYRLTKPNVRINRTQFYNLLSHNTKFLGNLPEPKRDEATGEPYWTGRQALSMIIPDKINIRSPNKSFQSDLRGGDNDNYVVIENGELIQGIVDKTIYQNRTRGLVHSIFNECGPEETRQFFDNTQRLICDWLVSDGFSVGISDLIIPGEDLEKMHRTITDMKKQVYDIIRKIHENKFDTSIALTTINDFFEEEVNKILNNTIEKVGKMGMSKINDNENRMINMVKSGSKGSPTNVSQMIACLGQQNVEGRRIAYGFDDRTLPHYTKYDDGPESRGFVENSFVTGLTPQEFFFHAMGGREGLIDTAVKTSETGYIQRKLVKAMEDCKITFDNTVRNANGSIIQFLYGEDGMDATKIESQNLHYIDLDFSALKKTYLLTKQDNLKYLVADKFIQQLDKPDNWKLLREHFDIVRADRDFVIKKLFNYRKESGIMYPISFARSITTARSLFADSIGNLNEIDPIYVLKTIDGLCEELKFPSQFNPGNRLLQILIRCFLSPKRVVLEYKLDKLAFDYIVHDVRHKFYDAMAHPSEMVGVVAAQSIGEPCTQMTLNTFHLSGVSSASTAVRGVPRIKELLSVTKNIKTPVMTICVKEQYRQDKETCKKILNSIQTTYFRDIVEDTKIFYDPDDDTSQIDDDRFFVQTYRQFIADRRDDLSPMLLRFQFNKEKMLEYNVTMMDIYHTLTEFYNIEDRKTSDIEAVFSDDNAEKLVLRLKLKDQESNERDIITELEALKKSILDIIITGVKQINKVVMNKKEYPKYNEELLNFENTYEWILETSGTNLIDILCHKYIDSRRTVSNDINEIISLLGIEAARQALYNEIYEVISSASLFVNYRHIALLVDTMTNRGYLLSIDRHGINRGDVGPLAKCSFEETTDMLIKAGTFSELDRINGVSANIMLGQLPPAGTGDTDVLIDYDVINTSIIDDQEGLYPSDSDLDEELAGMYSDLEEEDIKIHYIMPKLDDEFDRYRDFKVVFPI